MKQKGFTIVELLIVIVVIGILAAITIVAFNGVQARAENNKTVSAVGQYVRILKGYAVNNNNLYPIASYPCLAPHTTPATKCANVTDATGACTGAGGAATQATFDTALKTEVASLPQPSTQSMNCGGKMYGGAWYNSTTGATATVVYYLRGDVSCASISGLRQDTRYQADDTTACYNTILAM